MAGDALPELATLQFIQLLGFFARSAATVRLALGGHLAVVFRSMFAGGSATALAAHNRGGRNRLLEQIVGEG